MARKSASTAKAKTVNHFIREWRKHRKMTQEQLAEAIGQTSGAISQLENGLINYTQPTLEAIASALSTSPSNLLGQNPDRESDFAPLLEKAERLEGERRDQVRRILAAALVGSGG